MPSLGLRSSVHHPQALRLGVSLRNDITQKAPASCDYQSVLRAGQLDSLGNDVAPDCVEAGNYWQVAMRVAKAEGSAWRPTAEQAIALLGKWGSPTEGTNLADAQRFAATDGIPMGIDLDVVLPVAIGTDPDEISRATWLYGSAGLCWNLPAYLQDAAYRDIWDVADPGASEAAIVPGGWGAHYTTSGRYTAADRAVISWGYQPIVTPAFAALYLVSACAGLSRRWCDAMGRSPAGWDWAQADAARRMFA
ncbi:MAG: hypothetical protein ACREDC_00165 [Bradyrhizobium sp.]